MTSTEILIWESTQCKDDVIGLAAFFIFSFCEATHYH